MRYGLIAASDVDVAARLSLCTNMDNKSQLLIYGHRCVYRSFVSKAEGMIVENGFHLETLHPICSRLRNLM